MRMFIKSPELSTVVVAAVRDRLAFPHINLSAGLLTMRRRNFGLCGGGGA